MHPILRLYEDILPGDAQEIPVPPLPRMIFAVRGMLTVGGRVLGAGEAWYGEGPEAHHAHIGKVGTPTMGGIVILVGMGIAYLVARVTNARFSVAGAGVLLASFGLGGVGFLDEATY